MSRLTELTDLVQTVLGTLVPGDGRLVPERGGLTQSGRAFDVRPVGATVQSWERPGDAAKANLGERFVIEIRFVMAAQAAAVRTAAVAHASDILSGLADIGNLPPGGTLSQVIPGAPVIRTKTPPNGPATVTLELPVTVYS